LPELLDQLLKKDGLSYWVDADALREEGIVWTTSMVTPDAKKMSIAARLDAALSGLRLSWRVADEVVQITTQSRASEALFTRVYDVRRLITPISRSKPWRCSCKTIKNWGRGKSSMVKVAV